MLLGLLLTSSAYAVMSKNDLSKMIDNSANADFFAKKNLITFPLKFDGWNKAASELSDYISQTKSKKFIDAFARLQNVSNEIMNNLKISYNAYLRPALPNELQSTGTSDYKKLNVSKVNFVEIDKIVKNLAEYNKTITEVKDVLKKDVSVFGKSKDAKELLNKFADTLTNILNTIQKDYEELSKKNVFGLDQTECVVCFDDFDNNSHKRMIFLPCKHANVCSDCSKNLKECPSCRAKIEEKIVF